MVLFLSSDDVRKYVIWISRLRSKPSGTGVRVDFHLPGSAMHTSLFLDLFMIALVVAAVEIMGSTGSQSDCRHQTGMGSWAKRQLCADTQHPAASPRLGRIAAHCFNALCHRQSCQQDKAPHAHDLRTLRDHQYQDASLGAGAGRLKSGR